MYDYKDMGCARVKKRDAEDSWLQYPAALIKPLLQLADLSSNGRKVHLHSTFKLHRFRFLIWTRLYSTLD